MIGVCLISIPSIDASSQGTMTIKSSQKNVEIHKPITFSGKVIDNNWDPIAYSTIMIWEKDDKNNSYVAYAKTNGHGEYSVTVNAKYWDGKGQAVEIYAFSQSGSITSPVITIYIDEPKPYSTKTTLEKNYYSTEDTNLILKTEIDKKTKNILLFPYLTSSSGKQLDAQTLYLNVDGALIGTSPSNQWVDLGSYKSGSHTIIVNYLGSLMGSINYQDSSEKIYFENTNSKKTQSTNYDTSKNIKITSDDDPYKDSTYNLKSKYYDVLQELESGIKLSTSTLSGLSFENHDAQKKIEFAWDVQYETQAYVDEGKNILKQTEVYLKNHNYQKAWAKLHQFDQQANFVKINMNLMIAEIKEGKELEESFQEKNKSCFLFWCSSSDTTKGLDNKITKLELKTEKIKNKQKDIVNDYQNIVYEQKLTKQKDDSKKEQEILKKEQKAELKQQQILAKQEQQRLEEEQRQTELRAKQEQQRLEQEQRQTELRAKQEQQRLEQEQRQTELRAKQEQQRLEEKNRLDAERNQIKLDAKNVPLVKGWMKGELTYYVNKLPSYTSQSVRNNVENLASWMDGKYLNGVKMKRSYSGGDITINWVKDYQEDAIGRMVGSHLIVGLGSSHCGGDWRPFDSVTVYRIMYHEIGHALGQAHNNDYNNIMYGEGTGNKYEYDYDERIVLSDGYWQQIYFCNTGNISFSTAQSSDSSAGYKVYVLGNNNTPQNVINGKGEFYPDCSGYNNLKKAFSHSCSVQKGSSLVLYNPSTFGTGNDAQIDVKIVNMNPSKDMDYTFKSDSRFHGLSDNYLNRVKELFR